MSWVTAAAQVQSPAWSSGLRIRHCCSCGVGHSNGLDSAHGLRTSRCGCSPPPKKIPLLLLYIKKRALFYGASPGGHECIELEKKRAVWNICSGFQKNEWVWWLNLFTYLIIFFLFKAAHAAYRNCAARGQIRAAAADLHHSHSNIRSELHLWPTPQLMASPDP